MGKCFVTKWEAAVDNSDLITLGKVILTLPELEDTTPDIKRSYYIEGNNVNVKIENGTMWVGGVRYTEFNTSTFGGSVGGLITGIASGGTIIIDAYNVVKLQLPGTDENGIEQLFVTNTFKAFLNSNPGVYGIARGLIKNATGLLYLNDTTSGTEQIGFTDAEIEDFVERNPGILVLDVRQNIPTSAISNTSIQEISLGKGDVKNLPATIKKFTASSLTGSITELVEKFRAAGRTSGKIPVGGILQTVNLTIDNGSGQEITCAKWAMDNNIPQVGDGYLVWTSDSISLTNVSTDAERPITFMAV
jgi:hypothetical protein